MLLFVYYTLMTTRNAPRALGWVVAIGNILLEHIEGAYIGHLCIRLAKYGHKHDMKLAQRQADTHAIF